MQSECIEKISSLFKKNVQKNHIFITGANGFVGKHLQRELIARGFRVSVATRSDLDLDDQNVEQYIVDLTDKIKVFDILQSLKPDYVVHLASEKNRNNNPDSFIKDYDGNVSMALNLVDACRNLLNLKKFIFLGSCDEYGLGPRPYNENQFELPSGAYGLSKLSITKLLLCLYHTESFPSVVLRASVIYGPEQNDDMFVPSLINSLISRDDFPMTFGDQLRDFVYVSDVVEAIMKVLSADERLDGKILNIGLGASYKVNHIAKIAANLIAPTALSQIKFGAVEYRSNEVMDYSLNVSRASELLNWSPKVNVEDGIRKTVNYFKQSKA